MSMTKVLLIFLTLSMANVPLYSQAALWHKGGGINSIWYSNTLQRLGVTFDNKYIFIGFDLYDRTTGKSVPSSVNSKFVTENLGTSQHWRYHIVRDTSLSIYALHVEDNRAVYIRKTQLYPQLKVIGISESASVVVFDDGTIYDILTGSLLSSMRGWNKYLPFVLSNNMIIYSDTNSSTVTFHLKTRKTTYLKGLDNLNQIHISPNDSMIVRHTEDSIRIMDIASDSATTYRVLRKADYNYACFIDANILALLKIEDTFCIIEKYNIAKDSVIQKLHFPNNHLNFKYSYADVTSISHFVRDSKEIDFYYVYSSFDRCFDMPGSMLHSLSIISTNAPDKCETFPDKIRIRRNTMTFLDGDSTFIYLDDSSNVYVRSSYDGLLKSQWNLDIPLRQYNSKNYAMSYTLACPHNSFLMAHEDSLYMISVEKRQVTRRVKVSDSTIKFIRYSHDKRFILIVSEDKEIIIVNAEDLAVHHTVVCNGKINAAAMVGNILYYACLNSNSIIHYDITTQTIIDSIPTKSNVIALQSDASSYTQDFPHFITNSSSNAIYKSKYELYSLSPNISYYSYPAEHLPTIWSIRKNIPFNSLVFPSDKMYTVQIVEDSVIILGILENKFQCFSTEDIVFSSNGKYCCTISYEYNSMDMHTFPDITVTVQEKENSISDRQKMSLWVMGNTVTLQDNIEYTSCNLYTLEGASLGLCAMTKTGDKIMIQLPESISSGIYSLHLYDASSGNVRRVMIGK